MKIILQRFAYRHVIFDSKMAKSFYKLPEKDIKSAVAELVQEGVLIETESAQDATHGKAEASYILCKDVERLATYTAGAPKSVFAMHRNDFLVKSNEHWLKERFTHSYPDMLYYLLVDGEFRGAVAGKFRFTPAEVEDVMLDLPPEEAAMRKDEILQAVHVLCGENNPIKRFNGGEL